MAIRSSPSDGRDSFEFFFDAGSAAGACAAEDVFLAGKLLPFRPPVTSPPMKTQSEASKPPLSFRRKFTAEYRKLRKPPAQTKNQPSWRLLAFGPAPAPAKMEMREIRSRLRRRYAASPPPPPPAAGAGRWKLLQSLSCKAVGSGGVAVEPIGFLSGVHGF
ncbi:hypothetical protein IHE45_16G050300 [Dioscorea alata]|uniref:Uncharacterized protein n=1 Tax=Dioscorea alata TaxID=55571 RepID=A0ACB7UHD1_DIOAL|nr:hypothetical protein IHE45_16G050300 [Dioscorea alata]